MSNYLDYEPDVFYPEEFEEEDLLETYDYEDHLIPCNACFGTGLDRELDSDCLTCWGDGVV